MKHNVSESKKACLHFRKYGRGANVLLCFHGFGQDHDVYRVLEDRFGEKYTLFSFDLFYHGQSFWHEKTKPLSIEDWTEIITQFLIEQRIERFSLVGYSMGARFALATFNGFPKRIEQLILLAPDGIRKHFTYRLMTSFLITRRILRYIVINPKPYQSLLALLLRLRIVDKGVLKFSETQMQTRAMRRRVYYSWTMFRKLYVPINKTLSNIEDHATKVELVMGAYDRVVDLSDITPVARRFPASIVVLPVGHTGLLKAWANATSSL
jgi:pimeloyl-ACP methyl ester carboxylesterase